MKELAIVQKTYDLITWYVPILNRLPRDHKFILGDRMISGLYALLEELLTAQYTKEKWFFRNVCGTTGMACKQESRNSCLHAIPVVFYE